MYTLDRRRCLVGALTMSLLLLSAWGAPAQVSPSRWQATGGTINNPKNWSTKANWVNNNAPPPTGKQGYVLQFTGVNDPYVANNNLNDFHFGSVQLNTTFTGDNDGLKGQILTGSELFADTKNAPSTIV